MAKIMRDKKKVYINKNQILTRRQALLLGLGAVAGVSACTISTQLKYFNHSLQAANKLNEDFRLKADTPLRQRAAAKGLIYGAATLYDFLYKDAEFAKVFAQECGMLVTEGDLKWGDYLRPSPDRFNFTRADWLVNFARDRDMLFRGHTLVWKYVPKWFKDTVNGQNAEQVLLKHIKTIVERYAGQIHAWDVVNEAILPKDGRTDGLRKTPWLELLGPDYLEIAYRAAAQADPKALLVHNENRLDDVPEAEERRAYVLKLLERLISKGTPIHALGIQGHLLRRGSETKFNPNKLRTFLKDVASLGLKIMITEMDVTDKSLPVDMAMRDRMIAAAYRDFLSVVLDEPAVIAVTTWGLSDRYTWLTSKRQSRPDGVAPRPLPLDAELKRKLAWNAIALSFDQAPIRSPKLNH